jgi:hypothetical protein
MTSSADRPPEGDHPEDSTSRADEGSLDSPNPPAPGADLSSEQVDQAWAELVAGLESSKEEPPRGSGLSSRLIRRHDHSANDAHNDPPAATDPSTTPVSAGGPRDYAVADEEAIEELLDDGFVPPEPPPLPRPRDVVDKVAWGGAIGGPALLVSSSVMGWGSWLGGLGVAAFIGGFVMLVTRMRNERDHDDPGAVV